MKKLYATLKYKLLLPLLTLLSFQAFCQTAPPSPAADSLKMGLKFKTAPIYARLMPFAIYTGPGITTDRIAQMIEVGKTFNVVDVGIAFGRNSLRPDTSLFLEGKVTMDVGNIGIFANEMTIGAGRVFDNKGSLMLELSYNLFAQLSKNFGVGLTTGYYDFSNQTYGSSKSFFGVFIRYGLQRSDSGGILGLGRGRPGRRQGHHRGRGR
ncbi:hypothetical protein [Dyadobacter sp. CY356]|uniref:hypothetical protein n=1 Tax=Dyadobacter sp. CY356 TaxID=2906442 RepID=UPI001F3A556B|nr:hypothetical protein [Dyadobacter sp. CY356]MCF0054964.1 hypothetical protein [Dyadobacter sp. CY356]